MPSESTKQLLDRVYRNVRRNPDTRRMTSKSYKAYLKAYKEYLEASGALKGKE